MSMEIEGTDTDSKSSDPHSNEPLRKEMATASLVARALSGGTLMGLANLVPGISGGTMLLAAGIYPEFIQAVSDVTRLRLRWKSLLTLACVVAAAAIGILLLAGTLKSLVVTQRWIMYSLFIGLTLGGVPVVWKLARPASPALIVSGCCAFLAMVGLAWLQANQVVGAMGSNGFTLFLAGLAGASAMILPGLSGGYLLLLMGQYIPILSRIDQFKEAIKARDFAAAMDPALSVMVPVGLGVVVGVAVVGNLLQWLLSRFRKATLGFLLGLLIGSTVGLFPFQRGVAPVVGDTIKGRTVVAAIDDSNAEGNGELAPDEIPLNEVDAEDWPTEMFTPSGIQVASSLGLIGLGFAITMGIAAIGGKDSDLE